MEILEIIKKEIIIMLVAAAPVSELRGAIPLGISMGFSPLYSTILSIVGNIIPVPILLRVLNPIFRFLTDTKTLRPVAKYVKDRTLRKSDKVKKCSMLGLFLLVAIPLPTTGAYTGCMAASLLNLDYRSSLVAIIAGILCAGLIMISISYLGLHIFFLN